MKNEFLYNREEIVTCKKKRKNISFNITTKGLIESISPLKKREVVKYQELFFFNLDKKDQFLEEQLDNLNNHELAFIRFF